MTYRYKTKPYDHQHEEFTHHGADPIRGLFWEQGTGKTKPVLDSTTYLYEEEEIDGLCVIAPNGVHRNWVSDEIEAHVPDRVAERIRSHVWYSTDTQKHKRSFAGTLKHEGLAVLVMSYNAVWTGRGRDAWKAFLKNRRCMYVLDESHRIKSPGTKWSKRLLGSKVAAPYRRVLTGTPVAESPFDIYNQLRFLDGDVWRPYGIQNFAAFKTFFGVWETLYTRDERPYPHCVSYRNLEILYKHIHELGSRVTKDEVLDLPPKIYSKRYFELTPAQKRMYKELADDCVVEAACGELTAILAIVKLLRFQQICCGYLPASDDDDTLVPIPGDNPRLDLLVDICTDLPHQAILWARFREDHRLISGHKLFRDNCVVVNGEVTGPARDEALDRFKRGDVQFLVASPAAIGMGHTLNMAKTCVYYSNSFSLTDRIQSEDRPHRIGQDDKVHYVDIAATGTVDMRIIDSLRDKRSLSNSLTGDTLLEWI
jgi:SNF2 family DNA or RNA helicase